MAHERRLALGFILHRSFGEIGGQRDRSVPVWSVSLSARVQDVYLRVRIVKVLTAIN